jgi:pyroglutamyl-peptidase
MAKPRVLITGFGPFPGVPDNPSAWLAESLAARAAPVFDAEIEARVFPTEWGVAALTPDLYSALQPSLMIHFGVSQRAETLRLERFAYNRAAPCADARGALPPAGLVRAGGRARLGTKLPAARIADRLSAGGLPAVPSGSAGSYVCNYLYYHALDWAEQSDCLALFVHIPLPRRAGPFTESALLSGAEGILRCALEAARQGASLNLAGAVLAATAAPRAKDARR